MPTAGELLTPHIRLERELGEGGMGSIWIGRHLSLNTDVAVKFITAELADNEEVRSRFTREATAAAQIKSPHIVQVFDHGLTENGSPYIVMELLHGEDLQDRLDRVERLTLAETVQLVRHVSKALSRAHQVGIVHRDIKPSNIYLVESDGEFFAKVLDFGIAKNQSSPVDDVTKTGVQIGTPHYMSPEQVMSSKETDFRADLWALAVVAYRCLTGHLPFTGETLGAINIAVNSAVFVPASALEPTLPKTLDSLFRRAFARLPDERFASTRQLAEAFIAAVPRDARSLRPPVGVVVDVVEPQTKSRENVTTQPFAGNKAKRESTPATKIAPRAETKPKSKIVQFAVLGAIAAGSIAASFALRGGGAASTDAPAATRATVAPPPNAVALVSPVPAPVAPTAPVADTDLAAAVAPSPSASVAPPSGSAHAALHRATQIDKAASSAHASTSAAPTNSSRPLKDRGF